MPYVCLHKLPLWNFSPCFLYFNDTSISIKHIIIINFFIFLKSIFICCTFKKMRPHRVLLRFINIESFFRPFEFFFSIADDSDVSSSIEGKWKVKYMQVFLIYIQCFRGEDFFRFWLPSLLELTSHVDEHVYIFDRISNMGLRFILVYKRRNKIK